jgi:pSer/pThr/pTyr-binding forkhead associated (FHA) protein
VSDFFTVAEFYKRFAQISKWELVDMGSLNGTLVNYRSVAANHSLNAPIRQRGSPVGLVNGDIVTLGSTSQVLVNFFTTQRYGEMEIFCP